MFKYIWIIMLVAIACGVFGYIGLTIVETIKEDEPENLIEFFTDYYSNHEVIVNVIGIILVLALFTVFVWSLSVWMSTFE